MPIEARLARRKAASVFILTASERRLESSVSHIWIKQRQINNRQRQSKNRGKQKKKQAQRKCDWASTREEKKGALRNIDGLAARSAQGLAAPPCRPPAFCARVFPPSSATRACPADRAGFQNRGKDIRLASRHQFSEAVFRERDRSLEGACNLAFPQLSSVARGGPTCKSGAKKPRRPEANCLWKPRNSGQAGEPQETPAIRSNRRASRSNLTRKAARSWSEKSQLRTNSCGGNCTLAP